MNANMFSVIGLVIGWASFVATMGYVSYWAWFHPEKFKEREVKRVRDWWPFASYFRQYYGSDEFLSAMRAGATFFFVAFLSIGLLELLRFLGFIP